MMIVNPYTYLNLAHKLNGGIVWCYFSLHCEWSDQEYRNQLIGGTIAIAEQTMHFSCHKKQATSYFLCSIFSSHLKYFTLNGAKDVHKN